MNDPIKRFIEMLERESAHFDRIADEWAELGKYAQHLEDLQGSCNRNRG